jgi:hypothetical protein
MYIRSSLIHSIKLCLSLSFCVALFKLVDVLTFFTVTRKVHGVMKIYVAWFMNFKFFSADVNDFALEMVPAKHCISFIRPSRSQ